MAFVVAPEASAGAVNCFRLTWDGAASLVATSALELVADASQNYCLGLGKISATKVLAGYTVSTNTQQWVEIVTSGDPPTASGTPLRLSSASPSTLKRGIAMNADGTAAVMVGVVSGAQYLEIIDTSGSTPAHLGRIRASDQSGGGDTEIIQLPSGDFLFRHIVGQGSCDLYGWNNNSPYLKKAQLPVFDALNATDVVWGVSNTSLGVALEPTTTNFPALSAGEIWSRLIESE